MQHKEWNSLKRDVQALQAAMGTKNKQVNADTFGTYLQALKKADLGLPLKTMLSRNYKTQAVRAQAVVEKARQQGFDLLGAKVADKSTSAKKGRSEQGATPGGRSKSQSKGAGNAKPGTTTHPHERPFATFAKQLQHQGAPLTVLPPGTSITLDATGVGIMDATSIKHTFLRDLPTLEDYLAKLPLW